MMLPPALVRVRVQGDERRMRLWLPVFLLWPLLAALAALAVPVCALVAALQRRRGLARLILLAVPLALYLLCSLRGLRVDVAGRDGRVFVSID